MIILEIHQPGRILISSIIDRLRNAELSIQNGEILEKAIASKMHAVNRDLKNEDLMIDVEKAVNTIEILI